MYEKVTSFIDPDLLKSKISPVFSEKIMPVVTGKIVAPLKDKVAVPVKTKVGSVVKTKVSPLFQSKTEKGQGEEMETVYVKKDHKALWITLLVLAAIAVGVVFLIRYLKKDDDFEDDLEDDDLDFLEDEGCCCTDECEGECACGSETEEKAEECACECACSEEKTEETAE